VRVLSCNACSRVEGKPSLSTESEDRNFSNVFLDQVVEITRRIDAAQIESTAQILSELKQAGGRLFIVGSGGGAAHASHAVNDFRKIVEIESYTPTDNVAELTARINDDGWDTSYSKWLEGSKMNSADVLLVLSVGGGNREHKVSVNLVNCIDLAGEVGAKIIGVVGRDGGYTVEKADACVIIPPLFESTLTAHTEAFQAVIWHLLVSHPLLQPNAPKWESIT
jgi:D-sedoheptulose 7-phosphate isomerase